ncbi:hypothetical protein RYZ26_13055 [Terasakiella sp. A23]|uniref:hypothetical protein n=1 Tax=Terasakiella sp. FCG-A23 TaxID=3080561 RepID=UPI002952FBEF|nr:hypothetical protein [Terasakiella sp. A23]MDV7340527.1 hypothetical protein [Terasakiella sp. A23]
MNFPNLQLRLDILKALSFEIDNSKIAKEISRDKTTIQRWRIDVKKIKKSLEVDFIKSLCKFCKNQDGEKVLKLEFFTINDDMIWCEKIGLSKLKAAILCNYNIHVPNLLIDSAINAKDTSLYVGDYLLLRHDKEQALQERPYIQATVSIENNSDGSLEYKDFWAHEDEKQIYIGSVSIVGKVINILGEKKTTSAGNNQEVFWSGLEAKIDIVNDKITGLYGYVSDLTSGGQGHLYTDRLVLIKTSAEEVEKVKEDGLFYVDQDYVRRVAGEKWLNFIDAWKDVPID